MPHKSMLFLRLQSMPHETYDTADFRKSMPPWKHPISTFTNSVKVLPHERNEPQSSPPDSVTHSKLSTNFPSLACPLFFPATEIISSMANIKIIQIIIFSLLWPFSIVSSILFILLNKPGIMLLSLAQIGSSSHSKYLHLSSLYKYNHILIASAKWIFCTYLQKIALCLPTILDNHRIFF